GVQIIGLHWLLARTEGLHLTSPDEGVRRRTAEYLVELARCCRDVGGTLMVFGSPAQRRIPAGADKARAADYAADTFRRAAPASARPTSCRSSGPCGTAATAAGCRSRCSIIPRTRRRSPAKASATCANVSRGINH